MWFYSRMNLPVCLESEKALQIASWGQLTVTKLTLYDFFLVVDSQIGNETESQTYFLYEDYQKESLKGFWPTDQEK